VYSTTLDSVGENATLVREVDPAAVRDLHSAAAGDLYVGGAILGRSFLERGLIDELRLYVNPVVLGDGRLLFERGTPPMDLRLLETRRFTNGVVLLRYSVA
jgi:dihydrofolate reductase